MAEKKKKPKDKAVEKLEPEPKDRSGMTLQSKPGMTLQKRNRNDRGHLIGFLVASALLMAVVIAIVVNFTTIKDFIVGMHYRPAPEMEQIRTSLNLTGTGQRIFNASMPELMERAEFNQNCREVENESAILGCFRDDKIYVYNITDEELKGILELTAAHELLHAVYARMSDNKKSELVEPLTRVFEKNQELLGGEIDSYETGQRQEELYVRAGTEIKDLPDELEKHYAEIFGEQDKIVGFYESYIGVFRGIEEKLEKLLAETNALSAEITTKTAEYEARAEALGAKISEFNECAKTLDCFSSTSVFNKERATLMAEREALEALYNEINAKISQYNALVVEYNDNLLHGQFLNKTINSSEKVESVD